jgi:hypothetical protein
MINESDDWSDPKAFQRQERSQTAESVQVRGVQRKGDLLVCFAILA